MTLSRVCQGLGSSEGLDTKKLEVIPVRDTNDYSPLQMLRLEYMPELASVFNGVYSVSVSVFSLTPTARTNFLAVFLPNRRKLPLKCFKGYGHNSLTCLQTF
uniref:Uncharacterized protein n=1 Tax=Tetraselmis sp. GSL018 TaxID=582737 RepID=A0A061QQT5_9CHLO